MTTKFRGRFAAGILACAAAVTLAAGGATGAQAAAPTVYAGAFDLKTFTVVNTGGTNAPSALFYGNISVRATATTAADLTMSLICDDGQPYPLTTSIDNQNIRAKAVLPTRLIGHNCAFTAFAQPGKRVWLFTSAADEAANVNDANGWLETISKTGGL